MASVKERADAVWQRMIQQESRGRQFDAKGRPLTSPKGAIGRAQVMPATARRVATQMLGEEFDEKRYRTDAAYNERLGRTYFDWLVKRFDGDTVLAAAAYNAGEGSVDKWLKALGDPRRGQISHAEWAAKIPFRETRDYVARVTDVGMGGGTKGFDLARFEAGASGLIRAEAMPYIAPSVPAPGAEGERSLWRFLKLTTDLDWSIFALGRIAEKANVEFDPTYSLPVYGSPEWKQLTDGIPERFWDSFSAALSESHAQQIRARVLEEMAAEEELAQYGGWGIAGRLAVNILDPGAIALSAATLGLGTFAKGARLVKTARNARIGGDFAQARTALQGAHAAAKASPWANAGRVGLVAGAENAALETVLLQGSETKDAWDVALAATAGVVLGAGMSRLFSGAEKRALTNAYLKERTALEHAELDHAIEVRRQSLLESAGDPADLDTARALQAEIKALDDEIASLRGRLSITDMNRLSDRIVEVEANVAELVSRGAGAEDMEEVGKLLARVEKELRGRVKQRRALAQEIRYLQRKGRAVLPADQEARLRAETEARLRAEDERVWGDQVDSPKVARKRKKEVDEAVRKAIKDLPSDPKVARLERRMQDAGSAIERLNAERARLSRLYRDAADLRAAERELEALRRVAADPEAERLRLEELSARRARLASEAERLGKAGQAARELEMLDEIAARVRNLIALASDKLDPPVLDLNKVYGFGPSFGRDTLSAARYDGEFRGISDELIEAVPEPGKEVAQTAFAGFRKKIRTFSGILRGDESAFVRSKVGAYVGDSVGSKDGSVTVVGASEVAARLNRSMLARFNSAVDPAYTAWRKQAGKGPLKALSRETRNEFMELVGRAIKGEVIDDPHVNAAASKVRRIFADYLEEAKAAGVKGFENVEEMANYLPRFPLFERIHDLENRIGTGNVIDFFKRAIMSELAGEMPEDTLEYIAGKIANAYLLRMKKLRVGADAQMVSGVPLSDYSYLRHILNEAGESEKEIDTIISKLRAFQEAKGKDGGKMRHARRRVRFDETFVAKYRDEQLYRKTGEHRLIEVRMTDLFENNVEQLFHRYSRSLAGHIGMAKAAGVRSITDHQDNLNAIRKHLENSRSPDEIEALVKAADTAYKLVVGYPIEEPGLASDILRVARDYNFTTSMNQMGFAQIPDLAGLISKGYLRYTLKHSGFGELIRMMRRTDGSIVDDLARETEEWLGLATDFHNNAIFASYGDDLDRGFVAGVAGKLAHGIRVAGRGTQVVSGMAFINAFSQRLVAKAIIQRLTKEALEGGTMSPKRLAQLGIDEGMKNRIADQLRKHTAFVNNDVGGKVRLVNWAAWDDLEARDALLYGVFREATRLVQHEDLGDTGRWMHTTWGKVLIQFRRFGFVALTKQVLYGANMRDAEEGVRLLMSMALAAVSYTAQMHLKAAAISDEGERERFMDRYLSFGSIAAAAYARSSYASLFPAVIDTPLALTTGLRLFDTRSSGLASDLFMGNPTIALLKNIGTAVGAPMPALLRDDMDFDQGEARALRRLLPFQNMPGADFLANPLIDPLPKKDQDDDDDSVDWAWE